MREMEEDVDIYGDLPEFEAKLSGNPTSGKDKRVNESNDELKKQIFELTSQLEEFRKVNKTLEVNLSSLLKTAKAEIARKDRTISDLRKELDNASFRRGVYAKKHTNYVRTQAPRHSSKESVVPSMNIDNHHNRVDYDQPVPETLVAPYESNSVPINYSYYEQGNQENEDKAEEREQKTLMNRACSTLFGQRLLQKLMDQENNEKREKDASVKTVDIVKNIEKSEENIGLQEKAVEGNKENRDKKLNRHGQPSIQEVNVVDVDVQHETEHCQLEKCNEPLSRNPTKRTLEEESEQIGVKRKKIAHDELESVSGYENGPYKNLRVQETSNFRHHNSPPSRSGTERIIQDRREKHRDTDRVYDKRFKTKYSRKDGRFSEHRKSEEPFMDNRYIEHSYLQKRNDHRYDIDHANRRWNHHSENYYDKNKSDRWPHSKQFVNDRDWNSRHKKSYADKSDRGYEVRHFPEDDKYWRRDTYSCREYDKKSERYSIERRSHSTEADNYHEEKRNRQKSQSNTPLVKRKLKRVDMNEELESESLENEKEKREVQWPKTAETLEKGSIPNLETHTKDTIIERVEEASTQISVPDTIRDKSMQLEDGEIGDTSESSPIDPTTPVNSEAIENITEHVQASAVSISNPSTEELKLNVEPNKCSTDHVTLQQHEVSEGKEGEQPEIMIQHISVGNTIEISDKVVEIFGTFEDIKDTDSLTIEIQRERQNNINELVVSHPTEREEISEAVNTQHVNEENSVTVNDSIEKKLERLESSVNDSLPVSGFVGTFNSGDDVNVADPPNKETLQIQEERGEEVEKNLSIGEIECSSSNRIMVSSCSTISSCSTSSSSSSSTSTSSSSSSSEADEVQETNEVTTKDEPAPEPTSESVDNPHPIILSASPPKADVRISEPKEMLAPSEFQNSLDPPSETQSAVQILLQKPNRKNDSADAIGPPNVKGKVVVVVRRKRPVHLSNTGAVKIVDHSKSFNSAVVDTSNSSESTATSKPRSCRAPRTKIT